MEGTHLLVMPVFYCFQQVREDLARHTEELTQEHLWRRVGSLPPLGFHLRHLAGSIDRLTTYLMDDSLSQAQLAFLREETTPGATLPDLLAALQVTLHATETKLRTINPESMADARFIGRKRLPTTVYGLLVHIAEHTQRHLGQAITTAKLVRG
jgi:hypothetical protein